MKKWRSFIRECNCNALSETSDSHSTESPELEFPEEKIIKDSFELIDKYAPQFIKNSPYLNGIRFSGSDSDTPDKNSDGHMKGLYGKFSKDTVRPVLNYIEVAFKKENPRVYLKNITQHLAKVGHEKINDAFSDSAPFKGSDNLIFINLGLFRRKWANDIEKYPHSAYNYWLTTLAGTIVHEVAHAEDKNNEKFRKFIYNKMSDRLNSAIDDGLFDREMYNEAASTTKAEKAQAMRIFLDYFKQDLENLIPSLMAAAEIHAYNTEIEFYAAMQNDTGAPVSRSTASMISRRAEEQKNRVVAEKYKNRKPKNRKRQKKITRNKNKITIGGRPGDPQG